MFIDLPLKECLEHAEPVARSLRLLLEERQPDEEVEVRSDRHPEERMCDFRDELRGKALQLHEFVLALLRAVDEKQKDFQRFARLKSSENCL